MKRMLLGVMFVLLASAAVAQEAPVPFALGQVWTLKDAPEGSRFTILHMDILPGVTVVHGALSGYPPVVTQDGPADVNELHMPFLEEAVRSSVDVLERTDGRKPTRYRMTYNIWRELHGSFFTITIPEAAALGPSKWPREPK